jgi:hypothetical protein
VVCAFDDYERDVHYDNQDVDQDQVSHDLTRPFPLEIQRRLEEIPSVIDVEAGDDEFL